MGSHCALRFLYFRWQSWDAGESFAAVVVVEEGEEEQEEEMMDPSPGRPSRGLDVTS